MSNIIILFGLYDKYVIEHKKLPLTLIFLGGVSIVCCGIDDVTNGESEPLKKFVKLVNHNAQYMIYFLSISLAIYNEPCASSSRWRFRATNYVFPGLNAPYRVPLEISHPNSEVMSYIIKFMPLEVGLPFFNPSLTNFYPTIVAEEHLPVSVSPFTCPSKGFGYSLLVGNNVSLSNLGRVIHTTRSWVEKLCPIFDTELNNCHKFLGNVIHIASPVDHASGIDIFPAEFLHPFVSVYFSKVIPDLPSFINGLHPDPQLNRLVDKIGVSHVVLLKVLIVIDDIPVEQRVISIWVTRLTKDPNGKKCQKYKSHDHKITTEIFSIVDVITRICGEGGEAYLHGHTIVEYVLRINNDIDPGRRSYWVIRRPTHFAKNPSVKMTLLKKLEVPIIYYKCHLLVADIVPDRNENVTSGRDYLKNNI